MTYLLPADFREETGIPATAGLRLSDAEATDADLVTQIDEASRIIDALTDDHFEPIEDVPLALTSVDATLNTFTYANHGMIDGYVVRVSAGTMPTGLSVNTDYYVVGSTTNTFQLSATSGGAAIDITTAGSAVVVTRRTITLLLSGIGSSTQWVSKRIRSLLAVYVHNYAIAGSWQLQSSGGYEVSASATGATWQSVDLIRGKDRLDVVYGGTLSWGWGCWPSGKNLVKLLGQFGWPETPPKIKRGVALLVWDQLKPMQDVLRRASDYRTPDIQVSFASGGTGIPALDLIVEQYTRNDGVLVG